MANAKLAKGNTNPVAKASFTGNLLILKLLVEYNANLEIPTSNGNTPLMWAAFAGNADIVEYLLSKDVSLLNINKEGKNALDLAISRMHYSCALKLFSKGAMLRPIKEYESIIKAPYDLPKFIEYLKEKKEVKDESIFEIAESK